MSDEPTTSMKVAAHAHAWKGRVIRRAAWIQQKGDRCTWKRILHARGKQHGIARDATGNARTFEELGVGQELLDALREMNIHQPTEIQTMAMPEVMRGGDVLLASHTGSGKTLAYLLPLVQKLKDEERDGTTTRNRHPRALVMGPTRELTHQVLQVTKSLAHHAKFRSAGISGGGKLKVQKEALMNPLDLVVGTPGRILQHVEDGNLFLGDMKYLILDEADTMFDAGFGPEIRKIIRPLKSREKEDGQCVLVSATLTQPVQKLLAQEFPSMRTVFTDTLHKSVAEAKHSFVQVPASENKLRMLEDLIRGDVQRGKRVMVFCNTVGSCRAVDHHLQEGGFRTVNYHGDMPREDRTASLKEFAVDEAAVPILVCTDLAARGLDFDKSVEHVIMFDFPLNPVDYIHRTGRTARAGGRGRITSLVIKRDLVLAQRIEQAIRENAPLDALSSDRRGSQPFRSQSPASTGKHNSSTRGRDKEKSNRRPASNRGTRGAARLEVGREQKQGRRSSSSSRSRH